MQRRSRRQQAVPLAASWSHASTYAREPVSCKKACELLSWQCTPERQVNNDGLLLGQLEARNQPSRQRRARVVVQLGKPTRHF